MAKKKDSPVLTYLLASRSKQVLLGYGAKATRFHCRRYRAVACFAAGHDRPEAEHVIRQFNGDVYEQHVGWADRSVLDELEREHEGLSRELSPAKKGAARRVWSQSMRAVAELEADLERARSKLDGASADLVRAFGREPVELDGVVYDPSYVLERVLYVRRPDAAMVREKRWGGRVLIENNRVSGGPVARNMTNDEHETLNEDLRVHETLALEAVDRAERVQTVQVRPPRAGSRRESPLARMKRQGNVEVVPAELAKDRADWEMSSMSLAKKNELWTARPAQKQIVSNVLAGLEVSRETRAKILKEMQGRPLSALSRVVFEVLTPAPAA